MPTVSKPLADGMDRLLGHTATVHEITALSPGLVRLAFGQDRWRGLAAIPGQELEIRLDERTFRHYTPAAFDPAAGVMTVIATRYGNGPATRWLDGLRPGDRIRVLGPIGRVLTPSAAALVLLGDASAIGLLTAVAARKAGAQVRGAIEVAAPDLAATRALVERDAPAVDVLTWRADEPGQALVDWLGTALAGPAGWDETTAAVLAGPAGVLPDLRRRLMQRAGLRRRMVHTVAHWVPGRAGL